MPAVSGFSKRPAHRAVLTACLLVCLGLPGCTPWKPAGRGPGKLPGTADRAPPSGNTRWQDAAAGATDSTHASGDRAVLARCEDHQGRSIWIRTVPPAQAGLLTAQRAATANRPGQTQWRWRYPDLEEILARPPARRPNLHRCLADRDPVVAANAAIALARSGDDGGLEELAQAAYAPAINDPMRCAAIEAIAALEGPAVVRLLRELIDQYGRPPSQRGTSYRGALHAELVRGLARHVDPADDPRFAAALASHPVEVRLAALEAFSAGRRGTLPPQAVRLREDPDYRVRIAALQTIAGRRHVNAHRHLSAALGDGQIGVRTAAIAALGELGGAEAQATLLGQLDRPTERIRAAAVDSLARLGARAAVLDAVDDESWRVRLEVAEALAAYCDHNAAGVARRLLDDPSSQVQSRVVEAMWRWPLAHAGPVLLEAMDKPVLLTRKAAAGQLAGRWPPAAEFPVAASVQRRQGVLEGLRARFREQHGAVDAVSLAAAGSGAARAATIAPAQLARLERLVHDDDIEALVGFGPGLVEGLQRLAVDRQQVLPEKVYRDVLPRCGPVFAALDRLGGGEPSERRGAARELVRLSAERSLGRLALARLNQLVAAEEDQLVWRSVLAAVRGDPSEPAIRLAYTATGHGVAEVRRRACENLAACPHPGHAAVLRPALEDPSYSVRLAAVRALGTAGAPQDAGPLRRVLNSTDENLRLQTAIALLRLGDPAGAAELQRLAYSSDQQVRRGAAEVMGEIPQEEFLPSLVRMLDDTVAVRRAALASLPKVTGLDPSQIDPSQIDRRSPVTTTTGQVERWKQWYQRRAVSRRAVSRRAK